LLFEQTRYPASASAGNAPIEASAGKISKFPSRVHRPSPEHRVIAKENGSPREIKDDPNGSCGRSTHYLAAVVQSNDNDAGVIRGGAAEHPKRRMTQN
jgi:hypothetical protein